MFDPVFVRRQEEGSLVGHRITGLRGPALLAVGVLVALLLAACGSSGSSGSGSDAQGLLKQTFSGSHKVNSGNLSFSLTVDPTGSSTLTKPVSLAFAGPFQSMGAGKLPQSNFTVSISAEGHTGSLSILSTGTKGFVTLSGTSYQLPAADFQRLESSFSSIASSGGGGSSGKSSVLSRLGIDPLGWLGHPTVIGSESVGGTATTHVRARINLPALLGSLNTFLSKASSLGVAGASKLPSNLSAASQAKLAGEIQRPSFDLWTGATDRTVRKLTLGFSLPVTGQVSTLLGGLRQAGISLTLAYTNLNQPQTITAPTNVQPYSLFSAKLATLLQAVQSSVAAGATGSSSASAGSGTSTTTTPAGSSAAGATSSYGRCISNAGSDVAKMQKCSSLLSGGG
jgi:hypothetical protein